MAPSITTAEAEDAADALDMAQPETGGMYQSEADRIAALNEYYNRDDR